MDKHIGHLKIAFMWAFHYLKNETSYEEALKDIILKGGDTDTNAAIVGALLGALHGIEGIKIECIEKMLSYTYEEREEGHKQPNFLIPAYYLPQLLQGVYLNAPQKLSVIWAGQVIDNIKDL